MLSSLWWLSDTRFSITMIGSCEFYCRSAWEHCAAEETFGTDTCVQSCCSPRQCFGCFAGKRHDVAMSQVSTPSIQSSAE